MPRQRYRYVSVTVSSKMIVEKAHEYFKYLLTPEDQRLSLPVLSFGGRSETAIWFLQRLGKRLKYVSNRRGPGIQMQIASQDDLGTEIGRQIALSDKQWNFISSLLNAHFRRNLRDIVQVNAPSYFNDHPEYLSIYGDEDRELTDEELINLNHILSIKVKPGIEVVCPINGIKTEFGAYCRMLSPDDLLYLFDSLATERKEQLLPYLKNDIARLTLILWHLSTKSESGSSIVSSHWKNDTQARLQFLMNFYDTLYWEAVVSPSEPIRRFLSSGLLPRPNFGSGGSLGGAGVKLSRCQIERSDPRVDPTRFDFYTNDLGCRAVVEPVERFMNGNYIAFLLRAASGLRVAILDCKEEKNAAYVFRIGRPHEEGRRDWVKEAVLSKGEVLARAKAEESTTFMCRFCHTSSWKTQVRRFLESH